MKAIEPSGVRPPPRRARAPPQRRRRVARADASGRARARGAQRTEIVPFEARSRIGTPPRPSVPFTRPLAPRGRRRRSRARCGSRRCRRGCRRRRRPRSGRSSEMRPLLVARITPSEPSSSRSQWIMPFEVEASTEPRCSSSSILPFDERARRRPHVQCGLHLGVRRRDGDVADHVLDADRPVARLAAHRAAQPLDADAAVRGERRRRAARAARAPRRPRSRLRFQRPGDLEAEHEHAGLLARVEADRRRASSRAPSADSARATLRTFTSMSVAVLADHARLAVRVVDLERAAARRGEACASRSPPRARSRARPPGSSAGARRGRGPRRSRGRWWCFGVAREALAVPPGTSSAAASSSRQERCCSRRTSWSWRRIL